MLEALCTKHHPALAAIFQAKGDWCPEHGFPESICPLCHPERGGRPAADVDVADKDDGAPADGTKVKLKSAELATKAGIVTVPAIERANGPSINAVARVVYDAAKVALVNARAAGVVRELRVDGGAAVNVDLTAGTATGQGNDTLLSIENVLVIPTDEELETAVSELVAIAIDRWERS